MAARSIEVHQVRDHTMPGAVEWNTVAVTDEHPQLAVSIAQVLSAQGRHVQISASPGVQAEELVITAALTNRAACDVHWRALDHARAFRAAGGKSIILLQDTGGSFCSGPSQGWRGGMAALARTAAQEWPEMKIRCIDVAVNADDLSGTTQRLLSLFDSMLKVAGVDLAGQVYSMQTGACITPPSYVAPTTSNPDSDVWLVSGGARGVTAACVEALAQRKPGRFALLGRSMLAEWPSEIEKTDDIKELRRLLAARALAAGDRPVPKEIERAAKKALAGQDIRDTLSKLEAMGSKALYYPCDIADQQQVHDVLGQIQHELGPVRALVHGAGVLADSKLVDKSRHEFDRVFDTKVGGLQNILAALGDTPLSHTAFFSSAAAFYGNIGQGDYAMANEVLNRVAQSLKRRNPEAVVKSFNWGPWDSGMVDQTLARLFKERGISLIPEQQGAALFADEMLAGDNHRVELLVGEPWAG